jgi:hypothetical protein
VPDEKSFHMTPEEFRRHGHAVVDWIADYQSRVEAFPVLSQVKPGEIRASLPAHPPAQGEPFGALLKDVEDLILPGVTHWQSPNFFAYFPCNASGPGILGDLLSSGLNVQGMLWSTSPACTELETHVLDWLVEMLGLPEKFLSSSTGGGVIQDTASSAVLCALLAARERATGYACNQKGCDGRIVAYASTQTHSSLQKAAMISGLGVSNLRMIEVDENFAMRPDALARQIEADKVAACFPALSAPPWARPHRTRWIQFPRSPPFAVSTACGCTWMRQCRERRPCALNFAICKTESSSPTATISIRINGCSRISIAAASGSPTARRCCEPLAFCRNTCATRPRNREL